MQQDAMILEHIVITLLNIFDHDVDAGHFGQSAQNVGYNDIL
jgi:hypothetical protein